MEILFNNDTKLKEFKTRFNNLFPYLKIEFFNHSHETMQGSPKDDMVKEDLTISELNGQAGTVILDNDLTVANFESLVKNNLGLNVQVFRKSGNTWLETTNSDSWTLGKQNNHAYERK